MALGQLVVRLGLDAAEFTQGMSKAEADALRFGQNLGTGIRTAAIGAAAAITAVAAAGVAAFKVLNDQVEAIASFQNLAEKIGDTAENLASLKKASDVSGVSMDSIAAASVKLSAALSKTDEDGKGAAQAIKALGLDFDSFKKLAPVDQIDAVSKAMAGFEDGAGKTAVAVALWGKSGADMIPLLNDLANGSERQVTLTEAQIKAADDFSKSIARLKSDAESYKNELVAGAIPAMQEVLQQFILIKEYAGGASGGVSVLSAVMNGLRAAFEAIVILGSDVAFVFKAVGTEIGGIAAQLTALASFDFKGFKFIGDAMKQDAANARAELDKFQKDLLSRGAKPADASAGFKPSSNYGESSNKPSLAYSGVKTPKEAGGGAPKVSEADRYLESLQKQLLTVQDLTTAEKVWAEIQSGRLGKLTEMQKLNLQLAAAAVDQEKQKQAADKLANDLKLQNDKDSKAFDDARAAEKKAAYESEKRLIQEQQALGEQLRQSVMTDQEKINALKDRYTQLQAKEIISLETFSRLMDGLETKTDANTSAFINFQATAQQAASSLVDGLTDAIMQGKSLGDVFKNVVKQLAAMILKALLFKALQVGLNAIVPGMGDVVVGAAPKGNAGGGYVNQNTPYIVGEKGPELFTPSQSGKITTNAQTFKDAPVGKSGTSNVYNITAPGVSREEFMSGLNRTQAGAVSNVRDNKMRRRA